MEESSNRIANWALSVGLVKGDTIGLMMNNQPEFMMIWLAMTKIGVCTAFVNPAVQGKGLEHALAVVKAKVCPSLNILVEFVPC
jgi:acyl-coenzyme A synthetase/AMP-(fatty) acid ligase